MRSMTGFGVGEAFFDLRGDERPGAKSDKLTIEIRAVNHRFLDVRVRVPNNLPDLGTVVEALARERLTRGRFDVSVRLDGADLGAMVIDRDRARSVFHALTDLRDELAPGAEIPLSILATVPDLFVPSIEREGEAIRGAAATAFDAALRALDKMRLREGVSLAEDVARRLASVRRLMEAITARAPLIVEAYKKRLRDRAERLRLASDIEVEPGRLEQELALFADRIDVAEELTRLEGHCAHLETLLMSAEAVGRRLDFLLQEMAREANTIGAKSQDLGIAHAVVELKAEIERMREQVQNVE